jgi:hypothetical protein
MSTPADTRADTTEQTPTESTEVIEIDGSKLIESVEKMVGKQNISRLIIYKANGDTFLDLSFAAGLTMAVLTTFLLPKLLGLAIIGGLLGGFKIEVVHRDPESATPVAEAVQDEQKLGQETGEVLNE